MALITIKPVQRKCVCRSCGKTMKLGEDVAWCYHWGGNGTTVILCMSCVDELVELRGVML